MLYRAIYTQCLVCKLFLYFDEIYLRNIWIINTTKVIFSFLPFLIKILKEHFVSFGISSHLLQSSIWRDLSILIIYKVHITIYNNSLQSLAIKFCRLSYVMNINIRTIALEQMLLLANTFVTMFRNECNGIDDLFSWISMDLSRFWAFYSRALDEVA